MALWRGSVGGPWVRRGETGPVPVVFPPGIAEVVTSQSQAKVETGARKQDEAPGSMGQEENAELVIKAWQDGSS